MPTVRLNRPLVAGLLLLLTGVAGAQNIPREEYLRYVPLEYPTLVRRTEASARLGIFGDPAVPGYVDVDPRNGIDDRRDRVLEALARRFAPYMVLNTTAVPMDFMHFLGGRAAFPLFVDSWSLGGTGLELVGTQSLDWSALGGDGSTALENPDGLLLELLDRFHPDHPADPYAQGRAARPEEERFRVLFFDFPGEDPESWRREYENSISAALPRQYRSFLKAFVHPFVTTERDHLGRLLGHELILQYWFFYPFNDGGNNHEGDWEHINVSIAPLSGVEGLLDEDTIQRILRGDHAPDAADDPLVIRRIDYYFHQKVWPLDFSRPNAYLPRPEWEAQRRSLTPEHIGRRQLQEQIRRRAWMDDEETVLNTHPICLIGADNKGLDAVLSPPGSRNRDSHGTYPLPGMYKDIGPGGATELVDIDFDHRKWFRRGGLEAGPSDEPLRRGRMVRLDRPGRLQILPDWERVHDLVLEDPHARRDWAWMLLPIRWGYPAAQSPFAGVVAHAETGNLAPVGPTYSKGWNESGVSRSFALYEPHRFSGHFPLGVQDNFKNSWGFFNLTVPTLLVLPPFDLVDRIALAPVRLLTDPKPTYFPSETVPFRFVGTEAAVFAHGINEDWVNLMLNEDQVVEILIRYLLLEGVEPQGQVASEIIHDAASGYQFTLAFYLGQGFVSENTFRHSRSTLGFDLGLTSRREPFRARGDLSFYEYSGSVRYNLREGALLPYAKVGYGLSWYRLENVRTSTEESEDVPLETPDSPWTRKPQVWKWKNMWPNTFHLGFGLEWLILRSNASLPRGIDLSVRADMAWYHHSLGYKAIETSDGVVVNAEGAQVRIWRPGLSLGVQLGF
jgi:hypothetical protein